MAFSKKIFYAQKQQSVDSKASCSDFEDSDSEFKISETESELLDSKSIYFKLNDQDSQIEDDDNFQNQTPPKIPSNSTWKNVTGDRLHEFTFIGTPSINLFPGAMPIEVYRKLVDDSILEYIVQDKRKETNGKTEMLMRLQSF